MLLAATPYWFFQRLALEVSWGLLALSKNKKSLTHYLYRRHLSGDIMPYTCVLENCPNPEVLYLTRKDWADHMEKDHESVQYWLCTACLEPIKFHNKDHFIQHVRDQHIDAIPIDDDPSFADLCSYTGNQDLSSCPLCLPETGFNSKRCKGGGSGIDREDVLSHVAEHVHAFSLYSLPWLHPGDGELQYLGLAQSQVFDEDQWKYFADDPETPEADSNDSTEPPGSEGRFEGLPEPVFDDTGPPENEGWWSYNPGEAASASETDKNELQVAESSWPVQSDSAPESEVSEDKIDPKPLDFALERRLRLVKSFVRTATHFPSGVLSFLDQQHDSLSEPDEPQQLHDEWGFPIDIIQLHQSQCMRFSRLAFTYLTDRPAAFLAIECQLIFSSGVAGGFGILHDKNAPDLLRRSMLWHRAADCPTMVRLELHEGAAPTWSWMVYDGPFEYLNVPLSHVEWAEDDIQPPKEVGTWYDSHNITYFPLVSKAMAVVVRDLDVSQHSPTTTKSRVILDAGDGADIRKPSKCVVLGTVRGTSTGPQEDDAGDDTLFVLLVSTDGSRPEESGAPVYIRVGVASVPGSWVQTSTAGTRGTLV